MKNKQYDIVGTFPKINRKIEERDKVDIPNTHIHDLSHSWLGTCTSIKIVGDKLLCIKHQNNSRGPRSRNGKLVICTITNANKVYHN